MDGGSDASGRLLSDYEGFDSAKMARTPRTAPQRERRLLFMALTFHIYLMSPEDNAKVEARNLRSMTMAQTPLLGDQNTPLHVSIASGTGFKGAMPRQAVPFTPNPLATPLHGSLSANPYPGTKFSATPLRTPMRDNLSINSSRASSEVEMTPRDVKNTQSILKPNFNALPKPENNFELLVPENENVMELDNVLPVEDAAERNARLRQTQEEMERKVFLRRSRVVQVGLPRPANVDLSGLRKAFDVNLDGDPCLDKARWLVNLEMAQLLHHDSIAYPIPGTLHPGITQSDYVVPDDSAVEVAKYEIHLELAASLGFPNANSDQVREGLVALANFEEWDEESTWASVRQRLIFDATEKTMRESRDMTMEQRLAGYTTTLQTCHVSMIQAANAAAKAEKKLGIVLGGYQARSTALAKRITEAFTVLQKTNIDLRSFSRLRINESATGPSRVENLKEEVNDLEKRAKELQEKYGQLELERRSSDNRIATLEEKAMLEAEALNEAALA